MSCCAHTVMLFPDPRMRSPTALGLTDAVYPSLQMTEAQAELSNAINELQDALEKADALGLYTDSRIVAGHAVLEASRTSGGGLAIVSSLRQQTRVVNELVERTVQGLPTDLGAFDKVKEWLVQPFLGLPAWAWLAGGAAAVAAVSTGAIVTRRRR